MFVYHSEKETVSDYFPTNVDCELESTVAETLDCVHRWAEVDTFRLEPQISGLKEHVQACYNVITQSADNINALSDPEQENKVNSSVTPLSHEARLRCN